MINSIIEALIQIIGEYTPVTYTDYRIGYDGTVKAVEVVAGGMSGLDYPWLVSAIIFLGMLYFTYRIFYLLIPKIHRF